MAESLRGLEGQDTLNLGATECAMSAGQWVGRALRRCDEKAEAGN